MKAREQFLRTVCGCSECARYCHGMPGMLIPGDAEAITEELGISMSEMERDYLEASPGAKLGHRLPDGSVQVFTIHTIVPRCGENGSCVWLLPDGRCRIHACAPYGCSHFDSHMHRSEGDVRSLAGLQEIASDQEYRNRLARLAAAGHIAEPTAVRRKRVDRNFQGIAI